MRKEDKDEALSLRALLKTYLYKFTLTRSEDRELKKIMANHFYYDKKYLDDIDTYSEGHKLGLTSHVRAHQLFDRLGLSNEDRARVWADHKRKIGSYREVYNLKPIKEGRDNKDVTVGSGYGGRSIIRYPRKGHKNAWKKFYKLFPRLHPDYKPEKLSWPASPEAEKILSKKL